MSMQKKLSVAEAQNLAARAMAAGQWADAEQLCRAVLDAQPDNFGSLLMLARVHEVRGQIAGALELYDRAATLNPGHAFSSTRSAILRLRGRLGPPMPPLVAAPGQGRIQMTTLGMNGRFGNQILQYGFLKLYAQRHKLVAETSDWIGRDLFDLNDPMPSRHLPKLDETATDMFAALRGQAASFRDVDISGYFAGHTSGWNGLQAEFRALFKPGRKVRDALDKAMSRLRERGQTVVALHLRRGDFGYGRFWVAPTKWYLDWLKQIWTNLTNPVFYIATDDPSVLSDFAEYNPLSMSDLNCSIPGASFFLDFNILTSADHLAISNSSFSFTAAMLNGRARTFMRPHPERGALIPFDPWDASVLVDAVPQPDKVPDREQALLRAHLRAGMTVVHAGRFCSPWTTMARSIHPHLMIHEIFSCESLDDWIKRSKSTHIHLLAVERATDLARLLEGGRNALGYARIDRILFQLDVGDDAPASLSGFERLGYRLLRLEDGGLNRETQWPPAAPGSFMLVQERLLPLLFGRERDCIDLVAACARHGIAVGGVLHVGAHEGREISTYDAMDARPVVFVEANPHVHKRLEAGLAGRERVFAVNRAISDVAGKVQLHLASFDQSSSLLPMAKHREIYPQIAPVGMVEVDACTLDSLVDELALPFQDFTLLNIDVQGAEAMVLRGSVEVLRHVRAVNVEVNFDQLYQGGAQIEEIEDLLRASGFRRVELLSAFHESWGDGFYVRDTDAAEQAAR